MLFMCICMLLVGLESVCPGSPMVMSAAQCVMLVRCAARTERTETLRETLMSASSCFAFCLSVDCVLCRLSSTSGYR